jgi:hypothetical protein
MGAKLLRLLADHHLGLAERHRCDRRRSETAFSRGLGGPAVVSGEESPQSLSALYPPGIDEKRWVDGVPTHLGFVTLTTFVPASRSWMQRRSPRKMKSTSSNGRYVPTIGIS